MHWKLIRICLATVRWRRCSTPSALYCCNGIMFCQLQILKYIFNTRFFVCCNATPTFLNVFLYLWRFCLTPSSILSCECSTRNMVAVSWLVDDAEHKSVPLQARRGTARTVWSARRVSASPLRSPTRPVRPWRPSTSTRTRPGEQPLPVPATAATLSTSFYLAEGEEREGGREGGEWKGRGRGRKGEESHGSRGRRYGRRNSVRSL